MIPTIGVMVGLTGIVVCLYVVLRASQVWEQKDLGASVRVVCFLAGIAAGLFVVLIAILTWDLVSAGAEAAMELGNL
ncbi:hypothetical protein ACFL3S_10755 [Gemmatimonadota bacterium]